MSAAGGALLVKNVHILTMSLVASCGVANRDQMTAAFLEIQDSADRGPCRETGEGCFRLLSGQMGRVRLRNSGERGILFVSGESATRESGFIKPGSRLPVSEEAVVSDRRLFIRGFELQARCAASG